GEGVCGALRRDDHAEGQSSLRLSPAGSQVRAPAAAGRARRQGRSRNAAAEPSRIDEGRAAMIRSSSVLTLLFAAGAAAAVQAQTAPVSDSSAAAAVVTDYLQGLQFNDTLRLAKAFWPSTKLLWVKRDSTLGELTQ